MAHVLGNVVMDEMYDLESARANHLEQVDAIEDRLGSLGWEPRRGGFLASVGEGPLARGGPSDDRQDSAHVGSPPHVIRGTNPHLAVGIDWLSMTGDDHTIPMVRQILESHYGKGEPGKPLHFYPCVEDFHGGLVKLLYDTPETRERHRGKFSIQVAGSALAAMDADGRMALLRDLLGWKMKATRLDVAIDFVAGIEGSIHLVDETLAACERGELVGARRFRPIIEKTAQGRLTGATVYIGKRGSEGSGRMVRCYDKGLEQGTGVPNQWHRWEVEFSGDVAAEVASFLGGSVEWVEPAVSVALGAVDFKTVTGARDSCRRPRAEWWGGVVKFVRDQSLEPVQMMATRKRPTLAGWRRNLVKAVLPTILAMAERADCSVGDVVNALVEVSSVRRPTRKGPVLVEFEAELSRNGDWRCVA